MLIKKDDLKAFLSGDIDPSIYLDYSKAIDLMDKELEEMCHCNLNNNCSCCETRIKVWGNE